MRAFLPAVFVLSLAVALGGEPAPVRFAKPPAAKKANGKTTISFAVSAETDVAVYVLNAKGEVVRHLAAGVLGKSPPAPLKPGLAQSIEWDGKDDVGEPAKGGPFKVRVAAGMTPKHGGYAFSDDSKTYGILHTIRGIGVMSDGGIYVIVYRPYIRGTGTYEVLRFTRDGRYAGTMLPFGGHLSAKEVSGMRPLKDADGRLLPRYWTRTFRRVPFLPKQPVVQDAFVDKDDNLRMLVRAFSWSGSKFGITNIGRDGSIKGTQFGAPFAYDQPIGGAGLLELGIAQSNLEEGSLLVAGMNGCKGHAKPPLHAVFRVPLAGGKMVAIFGDPKTAGKDGKHLNTPCGLATDGKGNVYVGDTGNDRVLVFEEKSGKQIASLPVPKPYWVGVHRPTGAVYAYSAPSGPGEVVKFSSVKDTKPAARLVLPKVKTITIKEFRRLWVIALDSKGKTPRLWLGHCQNPEALRVSAPNQLGWCDDLGDRFSDIEPVKHRPDPKWGWPITSDPTHRYVMYKGSILDDRTGQIRKVKGRLGGTPKLGPDGLVYALPSGGNLRRKTVDGKTVPFSGVKPGKWMYRRDEKGRPHAFRELKNGERAHVGGASMKSELVQWPGTDQGLPVCPSGTSGCERDFTIDRRGHIYVKNRTRKYHGQMTVDVYDKDGKYLRTAIWECSDGAYGPRLDAAGNIYMVEGIVRGTDNVPPELASMKKTYSLYYGSLVKFSPKGGAAWAITPEEYQKNFGFPRPKPGLKQEKVTMIVNRWIKKDKVLEGAEWWRPGFSVYQNVGAGCHCFGHLFDTDDFGRSFFPDALGYRVIVIDAAGNEVLRLGSYGNRDNRGPHSWVRDPKTGGLRPPKNGEKSSFAQPEIAFAYLNSVAVTDRNIYALDAFNSRVTRITMDYAADKTVPVR
ncbi:MAG: hypothetical protein ACYTGB_11805 [Planctomycetota bacterium]|jgi:hypothetical protein